MSVGVSEAQTTTQLAPGADLGTLGAAADSLQATGPSWLRTLRIAAVDRARELGLPTRDFEEWRYTNLGSLADTEYRLPEADTGKAPLFSGPDLNPAARLVFVDGVLATATTEVAAEGVTVTPLPGDGAPAATFVAQLEEAVRAARNGLEALAAGLVTAGVAVQVERGAVLERPISVTFVNSGRDGALFSAPHVVVVAEAGAQVNVVEDHVGLNGGRGVTLGSTSIAAARDARVTHAMLVRDTEDTTNFSTLRIRQGRGSQVVSHRILTGGSLARNNVVASLDGEQADTVLNGLFVPKNRQQHDNHMRVEHRGLHCTSRQYYRGMLADRARGVFTGRIWVESEAQKTDAVQTNSNLLLDPTARVYSKPQLEIYADDVKCTHGATTGYLDQDALFYLRSRGLPQHEARLLLLHAFAGECIDRIEHAGLREWVRNQIDARLAALVGART